MTTKNIDLTITAWGVKDAKDQDIAPGTSVSLPRDEAKELIRSGHAKAKDAPAKKAAPRKKAAKKAAAKKTSPAPSPSPESK